MKHLFFLLIIFIPSLSFAHQLCEEKAKKYNAVRHVITETEFTVMQTSRVAENKSNFGKPFLFCLKEQENCKNKSSWLTSFQVINHFKKNKELVCSATTLKRLNGKQEVTIIYWTK